MKNNNEQTDLNLIYGRHPVMEALKAGIPLDKLYVRNNIDPGFLHKIKKMASSAGIVVSITQDTVLNRLACGANHQGIVARASAREYDSLEDILESAAKTKDPLILVLNEIQDPHNLGSLLRSAVGAGVCGVIIPRRRAARLSPAVGKVSAGADSHIKIALVTNISDTLEILKNRGFFVIGADADGDKSCFEWDFSGSLALVLGGEDKGLGVKVRKTCDIILHIPLKGPINSLNVGVAGAILMFEAVKKR